MAAIAGTERVSQNGPLLLAALRRLDGDDVRVLRARTHVLHALFQLRVPIDHRDLQQLHVTGSDALQVGLLVQNASSSGGELFELFQRYAPTDAAWEYIGGALAIRGHRTFAIETYLHMVPRLHVVVTSMPESGTRPQPPVDDQPDFPEPITWSWQRDPRGLLELCSGAARSPAVIDEVTADLARWRWLATLAGVSTPQIWSCRWCLAVPLHLPVDLAARVATARERAVADAAVIDAGLRTRGMLPPGLERTLPAPVVVVHDNRSADFRASWPLPVGLDR